MYKWMSTLYWDLFTEHDDIDLSNEKKRCLKKKKIFAKKKKKKSSQAKQEFCNVIVPRYQHFCERPSIPDS